MNSLFFSRSACLAVLASALVACAPSAARAPAASGSTTTTGADVSGAFAGSAEETGPTERVSETSTPAIAAPPPAESDGIVGQLACRTKTATDGTSELFLEWKGAAATGILRRVAPSGMVYVQKVRAERANGLIVADDSGGETDLVSHAATVAQQNGKPYMRLGDGNRSWAACE